MKKIIASLFFLLIFFFFTTPVSAETGTWKDRNTINFRSLDYARKTIDGKTSYIRSTDISDLCVAEVNTGSSNATKYAVPYREGAKINLIRNIRDDDKKADHITYAINIHLGDKILKAEDTTIKGDTLFYRNEVAYYGCDEVKDSKTPIDLSNITAANDLYRWEHRDLVQTSEGKKSYQRSPDNRFSWNADKNQCKEYIEINPSDKGKGTLSHNGKVNGAGNCDYEKRNVDIAQATENADKSPEQKLQEKENLQLPGITCGDGSDPGRNKCCLPSNNSLGIDIKDPKFFCLPLGGPCASELPLKIYEGYAKDSGPLKALDQVRDLSNETNGCVVGTADKPGLPDCICIPNPILDMCKQYFKNDPKELEQCTLCTANNQGVWTGLGCIKSTTAGFTQSLMGIGLSFAGVVALLCILYSAFLLQISQGNPDRIKKAREMLNSCIIGLILIIFAVLILQVIGVNILRIPGFGS